MIPCAPSGLVLLHVQCVFYYQSRAASFLTAGTSPARSIQHSNKFFLEKNRTRHRASSDLFIDLEFIIAQLPDRHMLIYCPRFYRYEESDVSGDEEGSEEEEGDEEIIEVEEDEEEEAPEDDGTFIFE